MATEENVILIKTYNFALKIIKLYKSMIYDHKEYDISRQLLACGTSIGSNSEEAAGAQSRKDFIAEFSIAYIESRETNYWLRSLKDSGLISADTANGIIADCQEIQKILTSILKAAKNLNL